MTKGKEANTCKICHTTVNHKTGLQCEGTCKRWTHFRCLKYSPEKIEHIKSGAIKVTCPCADCKSKELAKNNETLKLNDYGEYSIVGSARTRNHREDRNMPYHPKDDKETRCFDYVRDDCRRHKEPWDYLYRGHNHSHREGKVDVESKDRSKYREYSPYDEYDERYRHDIRLALVDIATSPLTSRNDCRRDRYRNIAAKSYSFGDIPYKFVQTMPATMNASTCFACPTIVSTAACPKKNMSCLVNSVKPCCSQPSVCSTMPCYYTPPCLSTIEELCCTIGRLTTQLNEVIYKMKECKKPCPQSTPCGPPPCGPPPCGPPPCGPPPCGPLPYAPPPCGPPPRGKPPPPPPCFCPGNPKSKGCGR